MNLEKPKLIDSDDFERLVQYQKWQSDVESFHFDVDTFRLCTLKGFNFNGFSPSYSSFALGLGVDSLFLQCCGITDLNPDAIGLKLR